MRRLLGALRSTTLLAAILSLVSYMTFSTPQVELETAGYALSQGDYDQAMRFARRAALIGDEATRKQAFRIVALAADALGRPDVADRYLKRCVTFEEYERADTLWHEGRAMLERGDEKGALEKFKESHRLVPDPDKASQIAWLLGRMR